MSFDEPWVREWFWETKFNCKRDKTVFSKHLGDKIVNE